MNSPGVFASTSIDMQKASRALALLLVMVSLLACGGRDREPPGSDGGPRDASVGDDAGDMESDGGAEVDGGAPPDASSGTDGGVDGGPAPAPPTAVCGQALALHRSWAPGPVALVPGGDQVLVADRSSVMVIDTETAAVERHLWAGGQVVTALAVSADAQWLGLGTTEGVYLARFADGALLHYATSVSDVRDLAFDPSGAHLAIAHRGYAPVILSVPSLATVRDGLRGHNWPPRALAWTPDGGTLYSASGDMIIAWDAATWTGTTVRSEEDANLGHPNLWLDPTDGGLFFADGRTIERWSPPAAAPEATRELAADVISVSGGGAAGTVVVTTEAAAAGDPTVHALGADDLSDAAAAATPLISHAGGAGGRLVTSHNDGTIRLWSSGPADASPTVMTSPWQTGVSDVTWAPGSDALVAATDAGELVELDGAGAERRRITVGTSAVPAVDLAPSGANLRASDGTLLRSWSWPDWVEDTPIDVGVSISAIAFSPDSSRVALGLGGAVVELRDASSGAVLGTGTGHDSSIADLCWVPDGSRLVSIDPTPIGNIRLWSGSDLSPLLTGGPWRSVYSCAVSNDGSELAIGGMYGGVSFHDSATLDDRGAFVGGSSTNGVHAVDYQPMGAFFALGDARGEVKFTARPDTAAAGPTFAEGMTVRDIAWSPDGTKIAVATHVGLGIWGCALE